VTLDISEYVVQHYIEWRNGSAVILNVTDKHNGLFSLSFSGFIYGELYNCYALQVPHGTESQAYYVLIKKDIFPSGIRPSSSADLVTLIHYPNQLLRSFKSIKHGWNKLENNENYAMRYKIDGVEIIRRRNKYNQPCDTNWENYDEVVIANHIKSVGCRTPYQTTKDDTRICFNKEKMKQGLFQLTTRDYGLPPPCKEMEKVYYTYGESISSTNAGRDNFWIGINFMDPNFKEIKQTR